MRRFAPFFFVCFALFFAAAPKDSVAGDRNAPKTEKKFEQALNEYLTQKLTAYTSWNIEEIQPNGKITSFEGFSIDTLRPLNVNGTFIYVPIAIESKNGKLKSLLTLRMKLKKMALVVLHDIEVNTELQVSDFVQQDVDATTVRGKLITDLAEVSRLKSKMFIKSGMYLTDQMIRRRSLIKHGDPILCYISKGGVVVSLDCTSRDDGNPGEIIHVMSKDKRIYRAKIESAEAAKIVD